MLTELGLASVDCGLGLCGKTFLGGGLAGMYWSDSSGRLSGGGSGRFEPQPPRNITTAMAIIAHSRTGNRSWVFRIISFPPYSNSIRAGLEIRYIRLELYIGLFSLGQYCWGGTFTAAPTTDFFAAPTMVLTVDGGWTIRVFCRRKNRRLQRG